MTAVSRANHLAEALVLTEITVRLVVKRTGQRLLIMYHRGVIGVLHIGGEVLRPGDVIG
jgi:hypothetical protein